MDNGYISVCNPAYAAELLYPAAQAALDYVRPAATARDPKRTGGWFSFARANADGVVTPVIGFAVGMVSAERFDKYRRLANEKAYRLGTLPEHISSWQSRNADAGKFGGAIRCYEDRLIFSFSGFSEHEDELLCTIAADKLGLIKNTRIQKIRKISENQLLHEYHLEFHDYPPSS